MKQVYIKTFVVLVFTILTQFLSAQVQKGDTIKIDSKAVSPLLRMPASVPVLFGEQSKNRLLQSVATVYTNQLTTTPSPQFLQALPGRVAGLNIGFTSGGPGLDGNGLSYNIRGPEPRSF